MVEILPPDRNWASIHQLPAALCLTWGFAYGSNFQTFSLHRKRSSDR